MADVDTTTPPSEPQVPASAELDRLLAENSNDVDATVAALFAELVPIVKRLDPDEVDRLNRRRRRLHLMLSEAGIRTTEIAKRSGAKADNVRQSLMKARSEDPAPTPAPANP